MTELRKIYRCPVCGNIVEVLNPGVGDLVCCGKPMILLKENTTDAYSLFAGDSVNDLLVYRGTDAGRIAAVTFLCCFHAIRLNGLFHETVYVHSGYPRLYQFFQFVENVSCDLAGLPHQSYFLFRFDDDHYYSPKADTMSANTFSRPVLPSMCTRLPAFS